MKIKQQVNELQEIEQLIKSMSNELELYRSLIERYRLKHGIFIQDGVVEISDDIDYHIGFDVKSEVVTLSSHELEKLGIIPRFKKIKEKYRELI